MLFTRCYYSLIVWGNDATTLFIRSLESSPNALDMAINSRMSTLRSINSILFMKDGGLPSLLANSRCDTPAPDLTDLRTVMTDRYSGDATQALCIMVDPLVLKRTHIYRQPHVPILGTLEVNLRTKNLSREIV